MLAALGRLTMFSLGFGFLEETGVENARKAFNFQYAGVAELVDARDLKSLGLKRLCGFDSRPPHQDYGSSPHNRQNPPLAKHASLLIASVKDLNPDGESSWPVGKQQAQDELVAPAPHPAAI